MKVDYRETYTKVYDSYAYSSSEIENAVEEIMQQRKELYEFLDYHTFENTLDKLFTQEK